MIEFHTHTVFSDGKLLPAALARRARMLDYQAVAFTDHADWTNYAWILERHMQSLTPRGLFCGLDLIVGLELTHVPPPLMHEMVDSARQNGAQLILAHGESLADGVEIGTNLAAIEAGVDILAHPGLIQEEEARLAGEKGVLLEISARSGHCLTNGHVAAVARKHGAQVVLGSDVHVAADLPSREQRRCIALGAGLSEEEYLQAERRAQDLLQTVRSRT
ncbi:histidinol phosphate phosphatase domain-containing protein [Desulfovermiculus halophilus]|jgi:histidinol phosphatase-like PHP family hydrolase|uniref:histidinol phosphate phosphatase domain-containing protein n=1 Tax=Desulfovermiculus halophilus TaxID=339722 RepID=UPI000486DC80|nr:histidinol phosphate phosphatase domain-containing protein [Desulfovermiculus halophilus]